MWKLELEKGSLEGKLPMHRAWIIVSEHTAGGDTDNMPRLSPECAGMGELKEYIDRLRKQLDQIERDGQRYFKRPLFPDASN